MKLEEFNNKKIAFLGLGIENLALIEYLKKKKISADFFVLDSRSKRELGERTAKLSGKNIKYILGKKYDSNLNQFDIIVRSPGYPLFSKNLLKAKSATVINPTDLFLSWCKSKNIIAVTGSKGKGTTASLIHHLLKAAGKTAHLGGNIGVAPFSFIHKIKPADWVVLELSSFQLENLQQSPKIAVITNIVKEHLKPADINNPNYHKTFSGYKTAKFKIASLLDKKNILVVNRNLKSKLPKKLHCQIKYFSKSNLASRLAGEHNKENIAAAILVAKIIKLNEKKIANTVKKFKGLKHRVQFVKTVKKVRYYNDSFATIPESTVIALKSFSQPIILLAGGADKGSDFKQLAKICIKKVKKIILFKGQATPRLKQTLIKAGFNRKNISLAESMSQAVLKAKKQSQPGDVILLSPATASFGLFKNYKQRGDLFIKEVSKLK